MFYIILGQRFCLSQDWWLFQQQQEADTLHQFWPDKIVSRKRNSNFTRTGWRLSNVAGQLLLVPVWASSKCSLSSEVWNWKWKRKPSEELDWEDNREELWQTAGNEAKSATVRHWHTAVPMNFYTGQFCHQAISLNFTDTVEADGDCNREAVKYENKSGSRSQVQCQT